MIDVISKVKELIDGLLSERGVELIDIVYRRESGGMALRLLVDKEGGIALDECAGLNHRVSELLDQGDIMIDGYTLEVSSPGLDRPLKTRRDFERVMGKRIRVHTYEPVNERRDFEGDVKFVDDEKIVVDEVEIGLKKISKAKLKIEV